MVRFKGYFLGLLFKCIYKSLCEGKWVFSVIRFGALVSLIVYVFGIFSDYIGLQEANVCHFVRCTCIVKHIYRLCLIGIFSFFDS